MIGQESNGVLGKGLFPDCPYYSPVRLSLEVDTVILSAVPTPRKAFYIISCEHRLGLK